MWKAHETLRNCRIVRLLSFTTEIEAHGLSRLLGFARVQRIPWIRDTQYGYVVTLKQLLCLSLDISIQFSHKSNLDWNYLNKPLCIYNVGPPFANRFLNTSWAVGLTYWIVYLHFFLYFDIRNYICLNTSYHFLLYSYFLDILYFFKYSCTNIFHRRSLCTLYMKYNSATTRSNCQHVFF